MPPYMTATCVGHTLLHKELPTRHAASKPLWSRVSQRTQARVCGSPFAHARYAHQARPASVASDRARLGETRETRPPRRCTVQGAGVQSSNMPLFHLRRKADREGRPSLQDSSELRELLPLDQQAQQMEQRTVPVDREWGEAWIEVWSRDLGSAEPETFLRHGVGVNGRVYEMWADRWKHEGQDHDARTFILEHLSQIRSGATGVPRCRECGTEKGLHAPYCSHAQRPETTPTDYQMIGNALGNDAAPLLLYLRLSPDGPAVDRAIEETLATATTEQKARYAITLARVDALKLELAALAAEDPPLITPYRDDAQQATQVLAQMLVHLLLQEVGTFARFGNELKSPWPIIPDRLDQLTALTASERSNLHGLCAYIRLTAMFTIGMQQLLRAEP
jgi:hypothetical protein